jgi:hypothetical protein
MTADAREMLSNVLAYTLGQWQKVHDAAASGWPTPDMQTGQKMAYNDVRNYVEDLLKQTS